MIYVTITHANSHLQRKQILPTMIVNHCIKWFRYKVEMGKFEMAKHEYETDVQNGKGAKMTMSLQKQMLISINIQNWTLKINIRWFHSIFY